MYDFHYIYIKTKYGDNEKLLFTDTDSVAYKIKIKDIYKDINPTLRNDLTLVTTRLIIHLELKQDLIAKCFGMFIDETGGKQIVEFIGLRATIYYYRMLDGSDDTNKM